MVGINHIKKESSFPSPNGNLEKQGPYLLDSRFRGNDALWVVFYVG